MSYKGGHLEFQYPKIYWRYMSAAWPSLDSLNKNSNIFFLKVNKLDEQMIDPGRDLDREFT